MLVAAVELPFCGATAENAATDVSKNDAVRISFMVVFLGYVEWIFWSRESLLPTQRFFPLSAITEFKFRVSWCGPPKTSTFHITG